MVLMTMMMDDGDVVDGNNDEGVKMQQDFLFVIHVFNCFHFRKHRQEEYQ